MAAFAGRLGAIIGALTSSAQRMRAEAETLGEDADTANAAAASRVLDASKSVAGRADELKREVDAFLARSRAA